MQNLTLAGSFHHRVNAAVPLPLGWRHGGKCEQGGESGAYLKLSPLFVGTGVLDGPRDVKQNKPLRIALDVIKAPSGMEAYGGECEQGGEREKNKFGRTQCPPIRIGLILKSVRKLDESSNFHLPKRTVGDAGPYKNN